MSAAALDVKDNRLLASLPLQDSERCRLCLEAVALVTGQVLHEAGQAARFAYFPIGAVVSMQLPSSDGACDEVALVGHEGMVGVSTFMGSVSHLRAVVQSPGRALRMNADRMRAEAEGSTAVLRLLLQYAATREAQIALGIVCSRHHNLQQRLALRLLLGMDRQQDSRLALTQEQLAVLLGVRRESVTEEAHRLQDAGLIRYARGRIAVMDPIGLAHRSCSCLSLLTGGLQHSEPSDNPVTVPTSHPSHPLRHHEHNGDAVAARAW